MSHPSVIRQEFRNLPQALDSILGDLALADLG
jgi:hypothetical protein